MFCPDSKCTMQSLAFHFYCTFKIRYLIKVITGYHTLCVEEPEDFPQEQAFTQFLPVSQCNNYSTLVLSVEDKYLMTFDRHFRLYLFYPHLWFRLSSFLSCFITKGEKLLPGRFAGSNKAFNPLAPDLIAVATRVIALSDFFSLFFQYFWPIWGRGPRAIEGSWKP